MGIIWGMTTTLIYHSAGLVSCRLVSWQIPDDINNYKIKFINLCNRVIEDLREDELYFTGDKGTRHLEKHGNEQYAGNFQHEIEEQAKKQQEQDKITEGVFKNPSPLLRECLANALDNFIKTNNMPRGCDLALLEKVLEDHGQTWFDGKHTMFLKALIVWNLIPQMNNAEFKRLINNTRQKYSLLPIEGYKSINTRPKDTQRCLQIAEFLHKSMKYRYSTT